MVQITYGTVACTVVRNVGFSCVPQGQLISDVVAVLILDGNHLRKLTASAVMH